MQRTIAHVDMDAFYASVEIRDQPSLAGLPVVVGGASDHRGVVAAASYEARKYGIHSAMPMARAERLCPNLVRIPPDFARYHDVSRQIMEILGSYTPLVEPLSLDEAFLDLTGTPLLRESGLRDVDGEALRTAGRRIKDEIRAATRLTASVGIAPVKFVAKIASDLEKPDGLVVVHPEELQSFLYPLPISRLWGVGPRTGAALQELGIRTIGDLAHADPKRLTARLGEHGEGLQSLAQGRDTREVVPDYEAKSYSHEETFARDTTDREFLESVLLGQAVRVSRRLREDGVCGRVVQLKLRFHDFQTLTRRRSLPAATDDADQIFAVGRTLLEGVWSGRAIRLIGLGAAEVVPAGGENLDLFRPPEQDQKRRKLTGAIDEIQKRFGTGKVVRARILRREQDKDPDAPAGGPVSAP